MKEEFLVFLHTILLLVSWLSPFWLDWKIIFICIGLYELQMFLFKGCILINLQFNKNIRKETDMTMYAYWLEKLGFKPNRKKLKFLSSYIMPLIILLLTLVWQILLDMPVWIKI